MNLIKDKWTKEDYNDFLDYLHSITDEKFKDFSTKIIVDDTLIGIRTPILKNIAKNIFNNNKHLIYNENNYYPNQDGYKLIANAVKKQLKLD